MIELAILVMIVVIVCLFLDSIYWTYQRSLRRGNICIAAALVLLTILLILVMINLNI